MTHSIHTVQHSSSVTLSLLKGLMNSVHVSSDKHYAQAQLHGLLSSRVMLTTQTSNSRDQHWVPSKESLSGVIFLLLDIRLITLCHIQYGISSVFFLLEYILTLVMDLSSLYTIQCSFQNYHPWTYTMPHQLSKYSTHHSILFRNSLCVC